MTNFKKWDNSDPINSEEDIEDSNVVELFEEKISASKDQPFEKENLKIDYVLKKDREATNQGLAHTENPAKIKCFNFYHRSRIECFMTKACIEANILFSPLPVFCLGTSQKRKESDHFIFHPKTGRPGWMELDGLSHIGESAVEKDSRLQPFRDLGIFTKSYICPEDTSNYFECMNWAKNTLDNFLECLERQDSIVGWEDYSK